ncbi:MAG: nuclear transport factor 2 family protein [Rhodanobacteraceae bacterium]
MTNRTLGAACLASAMFVATATTAPAAPATTVEQAAVTKLEQRWLAAVQPGGNRHALASILADDFIDVDWRGQIRHKADLVDAPPGQQGVVQHVTDLHVRVWGDTAVATGINHAHSTARGWTVAVPFTDVFARINGHWRAVSSQETVRKPVAPVSSH